MRVLMLSTDKKILDKNSEAQQRMADYGSVFDELHVVIYTKGPDIKERIAANVFVYTTNSFAGISYFFDAYELAGKIIKDRKISVITCQDPFETGLVGWFLKMRFHLPLQLQIHTDIFSPYFWKESFKNKLRVRLAKFLLPKADSIRVVSKRIRNSLLALYPKPYTLNPITILPVFVDIQRIQSAGIGTDLHKKYPRHDFIFLMASRLTREKNIGMAIEAMKDLCQMSNVQCQMLLLIVGDGPEEKYLKAKSSKLKANIVFEPWTDDLVSYYKTADAFLLTSNYEGYGRTVVGAMAAGLPVIMTNVGLAGDVLKDNLNGLIVPVGNSDELKRGMRILMDNKEKRSDIGRGSVKSVSNFTIKKDYLEKYADSLK